MAITPIPHALQVPTAEGTNEQDANTQIRGKIKYYSNPNALYSTCCNTLSYFRNCNVFFPVFLTVPVLLQLQLEGSFSPTVKWKVSLE